jgi:hypothetical protein
LQSLGRTAAWQTCPVHTRSWLDVLMVFTHPQREIRSTDF